MTDRRINPRVVRTKQQALAIARSLLLELGPLQLTYTSISERSGITRQTLYRHWPTREALLAELILTGPDVAYPSPGTDAATIVTDFLASLSAGMADGPTAAALMTLAAQADRDPASGTALAAIVTDRRSALNTLLHECNRHVSEDDFARLCGPVIYHQLIARRPVTDELIRVTVTAWLHRGVPSIEDYATGDPLPANP